MADQYRVERELGAGGMATANLVGTLEVLMKRALSNAVLVVLSGVVGISCGQTTEPAGGSIEQPRPAPIPFPDSIRTAANGLPPRAADSSTVVLGDTLAIGQIGMQPLIFGASAPMRITARFFVRDTSTGVYRQRVIPLAQCPFVLTLSRARSDFVVWRSDRAAGSVQCPTLAQVGTGTDVTATLDVRSVLGDSLPAGHYDATLDVRTASGRVFHYASGGLYLDASTDPPLFDYALLQMSATTEVTGYAPRYLTTRVVVRNPTRARLEVDHGVCLVNVRLFRNADRRGTAAWKSEFRKPPGSAFGYACILPLYTSVLPPGDSLVFPLSVPMYEVIGDSLASAHYYVSAELTLIGKRMPDGTFRPDFTTSLEAGEVDIVRESVRLPSSRVVNGLSVTATTRVIRGSSVDTLRTLVLVSNTSDHRIATTIASACPVIVYAYRSAALRDSVPIAPSTVLPSPTCFLDSYPIALNPGQSWVFGRDTPMWAITSRSEPGHYWFTAWLLVPGQVLLAAGDAEVK